MISPKIRTEPSDSRGDGRRQRLTTENSVGARIIEGLGDQSVTWLARETRQPENTIRDAIKRGIAKVDLAVAIASALGQSVDWLLTGTSAAPASTPLMLAEDADWVDLPQYDLRNVSDRGLGPVSMRAPVRRDWLYNVARTSTGLWLTNLLSDYQPADLAEGALVICRSIKRDELAEGHVCLWRIQDTVVVGRFSVVPDATMAQGRAGADPRYLASYLDPSLGIASKDLLVPPSAIGEDGRYHPIGRILGVMVRPI